MYLLSPGLTSQLVDAFNKASLIPAWYLKIFKFLGCWYSANTPVGLGYFVY